MFVRKGNGHTRSPNEPRNERLDQYHQCADCVYSAPRESHSSECRRRWIGHGLVSHLMPATIVIALISRTNASPRVPFQRAGENTDRLLITRS